MEAQQRDIEKGGCLAAAGWLVQAIFFISLALLALGLVGYHFVSNQFDEELRQRIVHELRQKFPRHIVGLRGARRIAGEGIELRALSISEVPESAVSDSRLVYIEEILLGCNTDLADLLTGKANLHGAVARGVKVRVTRRPDGQWDFAELIPRTKQDARFPVITIQDGALEIVDELKSAGPPISFRNLELSIRSRDRGMLPTRLTSPTESTPLEFASVPDADPEQAFVVEGSFISEFCNRVEFQGQLQGDLNLWEIKFQATHVDLNSKLLAQLPADVERLDKLWGKSAAVLDLTGRIWREPRSESETQFEVRGRVKDGRVESAWVPFEVGKVTIDFVATNRGVQVLSATAQREQTSLRVSGEMLGYSATSPMNFRVTAQRLTLDPRVGRNLPAKVQLGWQKFQPAGLLDADARFKFDGRTWRTDARLECLDVSFSYDRFPYRLENGRGIVEFRGDSMVTQGFVARANGRDVILNAAFDRLGPHCTGWLDFQVDEPVPIDEKLLAALDAKTQRVVRSLSPSGLVQAHGKLSREVADERFRRDFRLKLQSCAINYDRFPYPLYQVDGWIKITNDDWRFEGLTGQNDTAYVKCSGQFDSPSEGAGQLSLDFSVWDLPLEEELRNALPATAQRIWSGLRPGGTVDHVAIEARYDQRSQKLGLDVTAHKWSERQNVDGRGIRIEPEWFAYSMHDVTGSVRYRNGVLELQNLRAVHGATQMQAEGVSEFAASGAWNVRFTKLLADRMLVDRELLGALPNRLADALGKLNIKSPIHIIGPGSRPARAPSKSPNALELQGAPGEPVSSNWNFLVDIENGALDCAVKLDHIHGSAVLLGESDGQRFRTRGDLQIDSLTCHDVQLTQVRGPFEVDNSKLTFGTMVSRSRPDDTPRQVTATALRGALAGNGQVQLSNDCEFLVDTSIFNGDLGEAVRQISATTRDSEISGSVFGHLRLTGTCKGVHTLRGEGQLELSQANIYELPVMVRLLKLLRVREPDRSAFTSSDAKFRVEGDRIYFDNINFHGDVFSLREGTGEMDFQRQVNLQFYTMVGREELKIPVLQHVLREASPRLLTIHVKGTLDDPQVERELFREFNEGLKELFPETAQRRSENSTWRTGGLNLLKRR